jgi:hypothetical protein
MQNMMDQNVTDQNVGQVVTAVQRTLDEHQRQLAAMSALLVQPAPLPQERHYPGSTARLQPLDENGRARPIRPAGYVDVAFPLRSAGTAWGHNWRARAKLKVRDVARMTALQTSADITWMRDQILGAIYVDQQYVEQDDEFGALTVKPIANGDAQTYSIMEGSTAAATDDHIVAQAGAISATDPFPAMHDDLVEHPENSDTVLALIPTAQVADTEGLADFMELNDPNIATGADSDRLIAAFGGQVPGRVFGYHRSGVWLSEWKALVPNYVIGVTPGGEPPIGMREETEESLRGFRLADERPDYPFYETQWIRIAGFGAKNRVGAYVVRIGNGTYAVPAGYEQPMG